MKSNESSRDYMLSIVNIMKSYGENISHIIFVAKVLRFLTKKFEHVVADIEESKDFYDYSLD